MNASKQDQTRMKRDGYGASERAISEIEREKVERKQVHGPFVGRMYAYKSYKITKTSR